MAKKRIAILVILLVIAVLFGVCTIFSGCYILRQGVTMIGYLCQAVPLENAADEDFVRLVEEIRLFARDYLGLSVNREFTRYVTLDRDFLAAVVSASAKDSFQRHYWRFPVVGRLPYKGFFNVEGARRERERLERRDLDVLVRPVDAFSTLGWFNDPLYSFMRYYSPWRLADLMIHELLHATVFIRGQIQFNEELAQFVGKEGSRLFMERRFGLDSEEYRQMLASQADSRNFVGFIQELIAELEELYASGIGREKILIERERIIGAAKDRFYIEYDNLFTTDNFRGFLDMPINNAYLDLFRLYHTPDHFFELLFERSGSDLPAFIAAAKTVTRRGGNLRVQLANALVLCNIRLME